MMSTRKIEKLAAEVVDLSKQAATKVTILRDDMPIAAQRLMDTAKVKKLVFSISEGKLVVETRK